MRTASRAGASDADAMTTSSPSPDLPTPSSVNPTTQRFIGRRCLVTGAGSGIGRATVLRLAAEGAVSIAADVDLDGVRQTAALAGGAVTAETVDVRDEGDVQRLADRIAAGGPLDVLVNNAGIEHLGTATETSLAMWDDIFGVNLRGLFMVSRAMLPLLLAAAQARGEAAIVNNASLMGLVSSRRLVAYCASKAGVVSLTRSMALDHAEQGLRVNCVCPGIVHTPMLERRFAMAPDRAAAYQTAVARPPLHYLGRPDDVAAAIAYLASREARFVTGSALTIDGGVGAA
jgi:NAD(P)-dependent dehydrogenase (short-subunit alcohol dehydrogenase family)